MRLRLLIASCAVTLVFLAVGPSSAFGEGRVTHAATCDTVSYGGKSYVLYRRLVTCTFARDWVRRLHFTRRGPRGWRCTTGSNYRTGGRCQSGNRFFGWHPFD